jgi:DNA-binding response OmpR family regulator
MRAQVSDQSVALGTWIDNPQLGRILIVDDQRANVRLLEGILGNAGYKNIHSTTDARSVIELCHELKPDLMLLDLHMPFLSGFEVMKQVQDSLEPQTYFPILVLTADITVETRRTALNAGAMDFLTKPFDSIEVSLRAKNLITTRFLHLKVEGYARLLAEKLCSTNKLLSQNLGQK